MKKTQICIVGGGLAGLVSAIHLATYKIEVILFEKNHYPKHKVCGEYISKEILPYFEYLNINLFEHRAIDISKLKLSHQNGNALTLDLPLGGIGISRYAIDELLAIKAKSLGVQIIHEVVNSCDFENEKFKTKTNSIEVESDFAIIAHGKRSSLDKNLNRKFIAKKTPWIGIKAHYKTNHFNSDFVELHNFKGGYCGLSMVENKHINLCYLVHQNEFKKHKSIEDFNENVLKSNPFLKHFLDNAKLSFDHHLAIAQISFQNKPSIEDHKLFIGDAAGLIHPLCGNGMAMAIHSAKMVSEVILKYYKYNKIKRLELESTYAKEWQQTFKKRLYYGKIIQKILLNSALSSNLIKIVAKSPGLLKQVVKQTHGKPITV